MIVPFLLCIFVIVDAELNATQWNALKEVYDGLGALFQSTPRLRLNQLAPQVATRSTASDMSTARWRRRFAIQRSSIAVEVTLFRCELQQTLGLLSLTTIFR
jgi:hypothetical protein